MAKPGTTYVSAGHRRRRARFVVTVLVLVATVAGGYAVLRTVAGGDAGAGAGVVAGQSAGPSGGPVPSSGSSRPTASTSGDERPSTVTSTPAPTSSATNAEGFRTVVTTAIPVPTRTFALSARVPGTTNMQPAAAAAVNASVAAARKAGVTVSIRSAWRSEAFQRWLFERAVATYGSAREAARWVLAPEDSAHVKGYAVDVQPRAAGTWLERNGARYGLCRTYDNEWWHFEYLATSRCPARRASAAG